MKVWSDEWLIIQANALGLSVDFVDLNYQASPLTNKKTSLISEVGEVDENKEIFLTSIPSSPSSHPISNKDKEPLKK